MRTYTHTKLLISCFVFVQALPDFGPYLSEKERRVAEYKRSVEPLEVGVVEQHRPPYKITKHIPTLQVSSTHPPSTHSHSHMYAHRRKWGGLFLVLVPMVTLTTVNKW